MWGEALTPSSYSCAIGSLRGGVQPSRLEDQGSQVRKIRLGGNDRWVVPLRDEFGRSHLTALEVDATHLERGASQQSRIRRWG